MNLHAPHTKVGKNHDLKKIKKIGFFLFKSDFFDLNQICLIFLQQTKS